MLIFHLQKARREMNTAWRVGIEEPCLGPPIVQLTLSRYFHSLEKTKKWRCIFLENTAFKSGRAFFWEQFFQAKTHSFCEKTISKGPMIKCELKKKSAPTMWALLILTHLSCADCLYTLFLLKCTDGKSWLWTFFFFKNKVIWLD